MLTAARTKEAISAEWKEFDLDAAVWNIPAAKMKAGEPHIVYLSPQAIAVVRRMEGMDGRYVFPSPTGERKPLSNMAMLTLLTRMGVRDRTTVHGLCRATFSTWAYESNVARPDVIEACLAHREEDLVKAAYNRAQFAAERRALLAAWGDFFESALSSH
jgi:integrase